MNNKLDESSTCINNSETVEETINNSDFESIEIEKDELSLKVEKRNDKWGNLIPLFINKASNTPLFLIGPHWPFFLCLSTTISLITFMFHFFFWNSLTNAVKFSGIAIYLMQIVSYTYTFLINPGVVVKDNIVPEALEHGYKYCDQCMIVINTEENTNHCDECNICVLDYDHHCPWTSKCIGRGNLKGFYAFITFTMVLFGYFIFAVSMINI